MRGREGTGGGTKGRKEEGRNIEKWRGMMEVLDCRFVSFPNPFFFSIAYTIFEKKNQAFRNFYLEQENILSWYSIWLMWAYEITISYPLHTWSYGSFRSLRHSIQNYVQLLRYERSPRLVWNRLVDVEPNMWSCLTGYQPKQIRPRRLCHSVRSNPCLH